MLPNRLIDRYGQILLQKSDIQERQPARRVVEQGFALGWKAMIAREVSSMAMSR
jgi:hypothetical protein